MWGGRGGRPWNAVGAPKMLSQTPECVGGDPRMQGGETLECRGETLECGVTLQHVGGESTIIECKGEVLGS